MNIDDIQPRDQVYLDPWLGDYLHTNYIHASLLARAMHIHPSIITLWISGKRPIPHNRLAALALALDLTVDELVAHARTVKDGYTEAGMGRPPSPHPLLAKVMPVERVVIAVPEPLPKPQLPPSEVRLLWCDSTHGTGVARRHHHGPAPSWAPGFLQLERDPMPYTKPQAPRTHIVWPTRSVPVSPPAVEPPAPVSTETAPVALVDRDVLIDPSAWRDQEVPVAGPPMPPTEAVQERHVRRAQERRVARRVPEPAFVTAHHRGHIALGISCHCMAAS